MHPRFGALRSLLQKPPSQTTWHDLITELELWSRPALEAHGVPYALDHVRRWPVEIMRWPSREDMDAWQQARLVGRAAPARQPAPPPGAAHPARAPIGGVDARSPR